MSNDEWQTPDWLIEKARFVLDGITIDPCSSNAANQRVGALEIWTKENPLDFFELENKTGVMIQNFDASADRCQSLCYQSEIRLITNSYRSGLEHRRAARPVL